MKFLKIWLKQINLILIIILSSLLISSCSVRNRKSNASAGTGHNHRYTKQQDSLPKSHEIPNLANIREPQPKYEPKSRQGNKPQYTVFNKTYKVLPSSNGFKERGYASWYGTKFHGFKTANGEIYDMYAMTAAHKHLPLPTYAKITNLHNKRSVIVKVNDRGPFHGDRIVDLSYAAASKLGIIGNGVGMVEVVAINANNTIKDNNNNINIKKFNTKQNNLDFQLGVFAEESNAKKLAKQLDVLLTQHQENYNKYYKINIVSQNNKYNNNKNILYKVIVSAISGEELHINKLKNILAKIPNL